MAWICCCFMINEMPSKISIAPSRRLDGVREGNPVGVDGRKMTGRVNGWSLATSCWETSSRIVGWFISGWNIMALRWIVLMVLRKVWIDGILWLVVVVGNMDGFLTDGAAWMESYFVWRVVARRVFALVELDGKTLFDGTMDGIFEKCEMDGMWVGTTRMDFLRVCWMVGWLDGCSLVDGILFLGPREKEKFDGLLLDEGRRLTGWLLRWKPIRNGWNLTFAMESLLKNLSCHSRLLRRPLRPY